MPPRRSNTRTDQGDMDMAQLLGLLQQQTATLAQQQQLLQEQHQQLQQQQGQQPPVQPTVTFKSFQAVKPLDFQGTKDPVEAQIWLKEMEKAFALVKVSDEQKVDFASYFLKGESNYWWESAKALEAIEVIPWDRFKRIFLEKYFPRFMQNQMDLKFFNLKQENMSIDEYEKKFTELARFVGDYVDTDEKKAKRFQQGLKPWLRSRVAAFEINTYAEVVQKAMIIEGESDQNQKERGNLKRKAEAIERTQDQGKSTNRMERKPGFQNQGRNFKRNVPRNRNPETFSQNPNQPRFPRPSVPECKTCSKKHTGACAKADIVCFKCNSKGHYANECQNSKSNVTCYKCGKVGHMARDCRTPIPNNNLMRLTTSTPVNPMATSQIPTPILNPPLIQQVPALQAPSYPVHARTFNMNMNDAMRSSDVVAGTLSVNATSAKVLIDSGATRSFVSKDFVNKLKCDTRMLKEALNIVLSNQDQIPVDRVCLQCEVEISGHLFPVTLIPFRLGDFDIILGMDWLAEYNAQIDCKSKRVTLRSPKGDRVIFKGRR